MKKTKAILMALCAVLLVAASVMGTLAYLTSTDTVTNTFTVGNVKITLDEKDTDNDLNKADNVTVNSVIRDKANAYKLLPGHEYEKDPTIHVASTSEDCYLFVKVVNGIAAIEAADTDTSKTSIAAQMEAKGWDAVDAANGIYVYADAQGKPAAVTAGASVVIFDNFTISGSVDNDTLAAYAGKTIVIDAYAVQKDGFENEPASYIWSETFGETATTPTTDPAVAE